MSAQAGTATPNPSLVGYYLDDARYERALAVSRDWRTIGAVAPALLPAPDVRAACERLLYLEARLIDDERLEEWLALFVPELLYWIPATRDAPDPRQHITLELHDRRRLEDRVGRLRTAYAYSQMPPTRTSHQYTNLEMWTRAPGEVRVRCALHIDAWRMGHARAIGGWAGFVLVQIDGEWRIEMKQVNWLDPEYAQGNNTFTV